MNDITPASAQALTLYREALAAFGSGDYERAAQSARRSAEITAGGDALGLLARCFAMLGDEAQATATCRAALPFGPSDAGFFEFFAGYCRDRDPALYEAVLRYGVERHPGFAPLYDRLWNFLLASGRNGEIPAVMRKLTAAVPTREHFHALAVACRINKLNEEGVEASRRAIALGADFGNAYATLGRMLYALNRFDEAASAFEAALLAPQPDVSILSDLVFACQLSGQPEKAAQWRLKAEELGFCVGGLSPIGGALGDVDFTGSSERTHKELTPGDKWHTNGDIKYFPLDFPIKETLKDVIDTAIMNDMPPYPRLFNRRSRIVTFGSCFARELQKSLNARKMPMTTLAVPQGLNNTFALRSFIEWCLTGKRSQDSYWYDEDAGHGVVKWEAEEEQRHYAGMLKRADGLIFTLGLAEVWRDNKTGGVFWRGIPRGIFDSSRHEVVVSSPMENIANIETIIDLVRANCGDTPIIFTVSPVPLNATFNKKPCIVADAASKSILRAAVEMVTAQHRPGVYYWPSFEIVRWLGAHLKTPTFGFPGTGTSPRDVPRPVVDAIMDAFMTRLFAEEDLAALCDPATTASPAP